MIVKLDLMTICQNILKNIDSSYSMILIEAPGLGGEEYYLL